MKKYVFGAALLLLLLASTSTYAQGAAPAASQNLESAVVGGSKAAKPSAMRAQHVQAASAKRAITRADATGETAQPAGAVAPASGPKANGKQATLAPAAARPRKEQAPTTAPLPQSGE